MKRKLKISDSQIITISDSGNVTVPSETKMTISEIADLFGIYYREAKLHIRIIEKSGVAGGDYSMTCRAEGNRVCAEYYGLEMIIALAFRVQSGKTEVFRNWIVRRITQSSRYTVLTMPNQNSLLN